ncbi:MAG TPA: hypothetical protein VMT93_03245 [Gemmatimonadaceae bacterium]|nr:hypothetical protein [Gemmatimonadaceae bacterium]
MIDQPDPAAPAAPEEDALVDTSPAAPDRTAVTYGILLTVLAALAAYFVARAIR